ncbi:uncharacterized protein ACJ7VT_010059 [Polymixia lowei]
MPKSALSQETLEVLESMWAEGVQNHSSEENKLKVQQVAAATGLVDEQIKVWIYNRNRKKKVGGGRTKKKRLSGSTNKACSSIKGLTHSDTEKTGQDVFEVVESGGARQEQNDPGQDTSFQEAESSRAIMELPLENQEQQQETAAQLIQSVEGKIQKLQDCNCEVLVMVYNQSSGSLYTTGTPKGLDFLTSQNPGIHWQFAGAMSNSSCEYSYN